MLRRLIRVRTSTNLWPGTSRLMLEISLKFMVISVFPPVHSVRQIWMYLWVTVHTREMMES